MISCWAYSSKKKKNKKKNKKKEEEGEEDGGDLFLRNFQRTTRRHIPENRSLYDDNCENHPPVH
jgi:hypothetical protein